jgi:hypothetical protein
MMRSPSDGSKKVEFSLRCWAVPAGPDFPVYIMSSLFGCGDVYCSIAMIHVPEPRQDRSLGGSSLWKLSLEVPVYVGYFSYKYTAWENEANRWEEDGPLRIVNLTTNANGNGNGNGNSSIRVNDVFEYASAVRDDPQVVPTSHMDSQLPPTYPKKQYQQQQQQQNRAGIEASALR